MLQLAMARGRRISFVTAVFCCALQAFAGSGARAAEPKQVLLLHSFGNDFKPWSEYGRTIRAELYRQSPWPVDVIEHSLVTARSSDENPEIPFLEYLRALFAKKPPDIIVSIGAPAASFVQRHRQQLFATTPMVLTAVDQRRVQHSNLTSNDAVVAVRINYLAAFENILRVLPSTQNVLVVVGTSPIEKFWKDAIAKEIEPLAGRISVSWTDDMSFEALLKKASALPPQSAIFWELMLVDAAGVVHEGSASLARLLAAANAPIFSYDESFFGNGIVGGPLLLVADSSRETVAVALRLLGGQRPSEIKIPVVQFASPLFDWRQMRRWGISETRLPPGSQILHRELTVWDRYRWQIVAIVATILLQTTLIAWLLYEQRRRREVELEAHQRMSELAHMNRHATLGELSTSIAHELAQPLTAILANAQVGESIANSPSPDMAEIKEILADIRRDDHRAANIIHRLRSLLKKAPIELTHLDLDDIVNEVFGLVAVQATMRNVALRKVPAPGIPQVHGDKIQIQQVVLNLLINGIEAMADAPAGQREIVVRTAQIDEAFVEISISDRGPGIPADSLEKVFDAFFTTKETGMGMGLSIARTIVRAHRGQIWVENHVGGGAVFRLTLPLATRGA